MGTNYILIQAVSALTFIYIIRLIYTHKLRIGHSWFLFLLGIGFLVLSIWPNTINIVGWITGSTSWLSNILLFLITFLLIILVNCSLMITGLISRVKELAQQTAILRSEIDEMHSGIYQNKVERHAN